MLHRFAEKPGEVQKFEGADLSAAGLDLGDRRAGDSQMFSNELLRHSEPFSRLSKIRSNLLIHS